MAMNPTLLRPLGKTGLQITPIGLGMMEFAGGGGLLGAAFPVIEQAQKDAIVKAALDGGINWFDTAELYGAGVSERSLAAGLKAAGVQDGEVLVATKWWPLFRTAGNIPRSIDARLECLGDYPIGLYMVHQPFSFSSPEAEMDAMAKLVQAGKIRSVGVSNFSAAHMRRAHAALQKHGLPLAANQVHYSLLNRKIETDGILETARELGVTIIAYTPLAAGLLSGKYHQDPALLQRSGLVKRARFARRIERTRPVVEALLEMAPRYGATAAQVALNWLIYAQGELVVTIPGATKVSQAADAAGAMRFRLADADLAKLDALTRQYR